MLPLRYTSATGRPFLTVTELVQILGEPIHGVLTLLSTGALGSSIHKDGNFNKIFPVKGAPADFPDKGDILPLRAPIDSDEAFNFECKMGDEASFGDGDAYSYGYNFLATKNHIDGSGSSIQFEIANHDGNRNALYVHGRVMNDSPGGIPKSIYMAGANVMWQDFAYNLENEV